MTKIIDGQEIVRFWTMGSRYDNNSVCCLMDNDEIYRIKVTEFLKIVNGVKFKAKKKKVHTYLEVVE